MQSEAMIDSIRAEARDVKEFTGIALRRLSETHDPSLLLALVNSWSLSVREIDRKLIGKKLLRLLNSEDVDNPCVAREVLRHIGTTVCTCPSEDAWLAVFKFVGDGHLLSVNVEALNAAVRLVEEGQLPDPNLNAEGWRADVLRLSVSECSKAAKPAEYLLKKPAECLLIVADG